MSLPNLFNYDTYRELNYDLINLNNEELKEHYLNHGIYENRAYIKSIPYNFDIISYKKLNNDLINMNDEELKEHYINYGVRENRRYKYEESVGFSEDFNYNAYRDFNHDLHDMNDEQLHDHYITYGINESRIYKYDEKIGFIILRYVRDEQTNKYWQKCYDSIRQFYPENKIIIIDDNSNYNYISEKYLYNTEIIQSNFPQRGELLPYYYYLNNKFFDIACIIHDSVFFQKYMNLYVDKYKIIWEIEHHWDEDEDTIRMLRLFNDEELIDFYRNKSLWEGCFGAMSIIKHDYLVEINNKYNISLLLNVILNRENRKCFESISGCLFKKNNSNETNNSKITLFGNLHKYTVFGITYDDIHLYNHLPVVKVWTGR
jgi:hypothetical protein